MMQTLFDGPPLSEALDDAFNTAKTQAKQIPDDEVRDSSVEDLAHDVIENFTMQPPRVEPPRVADSGTTKIHVKDSPDEVVGGEFVLVGIPYEGKSQFLNLAPSLGQQPRKPEGRVEDSQIKIRFDWPAEEGRPDNLEEQIDDARSRIEKFCDLARQEIEQYNEDIRRAVTETIQQKKDQLEGLDDFVRDLPFPLQRRDDALRILPVHRKKVESKRVQDTADERDVEWTLSEETYKDILDALRSMSDVIERSPSAFRGMDEEDLRTHFLVPLNAQFERPATAETFNNQGKTDIYLPAEGRAVFIAECKFWRGAKRLRKAINQLLGYTTWRDTKTALLLFNRNQDTTRVLDQIPSVFEDHSNFLRQETYGADSEFRFVLHHDGDEQRDITVTVMVFDVPST